MSETQLGLALAEYGASKRPEIVAQLVRLARELAAKAGPQGITVSDLRLYAVQRNIISAKGQGRELSYLGAVMRKAGLVRTGERRRSCIAGTNGNLNSCWRMG